MKKDQKDWSGWPAVLASDGINLVPNGKNRIFMGATLEPGTHPNPQVLEHMKIMSGNAPNWIKRSSIKEQWSGLRGRPVDRAAPLLKKLEPGLILATGHYRNGILLAPASAEWVAEEVMRDHPA